MTEERDIKSPRGKVLVQWSWDAGGTIVERWFRHVPFDFFAVFAFAAAVDWLFELDAETGITRGAGGCQAFVNFGNRLLGRFGSGSRECKVDQAGRFAFPVEEFGGFGNPVD